MTDCSSCSWLFGRLGETAAGWSVTCVFSGDGTPRRATCWICVCWCFGCPTTAQEPWRWVACWLTAGARWGGSWAVTSCWSPANTLCCAALSTTGTPLPPTWRVQTPRQHFFSLRTDLCYPCCLCASSELQQVRGTWLHAGCLQLQTGYSGTGYSLQHHHRWRRHPTDRNERRATRGKAVSTWPTPTLMHDLTHSGVCWHCGVSTFTKGSDSGTLHRGERGWRVTTWPTAGRGLSSWWKTDTPDITSMCHVTAATAST